MMQTEELTRERVEVAARGAMTVTGVARRLGQCGKTMSGKTGRILRGLVPGLDELVKENRAGGGASTESIVPNATKPQDEDTTSPAEAAADCPYSRGLYRTLFIESTRSFRTTDDLIRRLGTMGHAEPAVHFALAVLKNPNHSSNGKRSTVLTKGDAIRLIALKRKPLVGETCL